MRANCCCIAYDVSFKVLTGAQIVCNIVHVQVLQKLISI
jgi:hypothetical protein